MKALILAAGYGTRLQPIIGDKPKALVEVAGETVLDRLIEKLLEVTQDIVLVSNQHYFSYFEDLLAKTDHQVQLLNDGSEAPETRLGAIGDIQFAIEQAGIDENLLIVAADNILDFSLKGFIEAFNKSQSLTLAVRHNPDMEDQQQRGVVTLNKAGQVINFQEKPEEPSSPWAAAPLYILPSELLPEVAAYLAAGGNPDAPGYLMEYLVSASGAEIWQLPGAIIDIGNPDSLLAAEAKLS